VPVARWKGFGGATNFNGTCYETLTWAAGMGAVTNHASIFCTTHVPTIHPIVAAKQCTTVAKPPSRSHCAVAGCGRSSSTMPDQSRLTVCTSFVTVTKPSNALVP
jgi:hypothetical protein